MRRLVPIVVALLALFAGCQAVGGFTDADSPEQTVASSTPTECDTDVLLPGSGNDHVTPKPLPERPETGSADAVGQFAGAYERAFAHNHELRDGVRSVAVELGETTVRDVESGYVVRIPVTVRSAHENGTATVQRAESYDAHYFLSERVLRRAETDPGGSPADVTLSESGLTLACWE